MPKIKSTYHFSEQLRVLGVDTGGTFTDFVYYEQGNLTIHKVLSTPHAPEQAILQGIKELSWKKNFFSGLIMTLANPKVILFYLGFLPTFVDLTSLTHMDILAISIVVTLVLGMVLLCYAWTASRAGRLFTNRKALKMTNRCAGGVMITAGCAILLKD